MDPLLNIVSNRRRDNYYGKPAAKDKPVVIHDDIFLFVENLRFTPDPEICALQAFK